MDGPPANRKKGVQVVEGGLHPHRWMSVNIAGLVAEPLPVRRELGGSPGRDLPRRGGISASMPQGLSPRRVPASDIIAVSRRSAPMEPPQPPAAPEAEPTRGIEAAESTPAIGAAERPQTVGGAKPAPATVEAEPTPALPAPGPELQAATPADEPGPSPVLPFPVKFRAEPPRDEAPAPEVPPVRRGSGLSRAQILLCALLTIVVLGGALYTAMRWTGRQAIIITVPEARGSVIT